MNTVIIEKKEELPSYISETELVDFLYTHLDRFRDEKPDIEKALNYCFSTEAGKGGFVTLAMEDNTLCGAVVMNNTGMEGYIPAHILVYVAVNAAMRGRGIGANIIQAAIKHAGGDVALHVEYDNPAKRLYERLGFGSKYAEMRYIKDA
jgi:GNAT superfamily N-acetyltransferase